MSSVWASNLYTPYLVSLVEYLKRCRSDGGRHEEKYLSFKIKLRKRIYEPEGQSRLAAGEGGVREGGEPGHPVGGRRLEDNGGCGDGTAARGRHVSFDLNQRR